MDRSKCCVLIPSLSPDERLPLYVNRLLLNGFGGVVVVNDGSEKKYNAFFEQCDLLKGCTVLGYEKNHGKGYALKFGIRHIYENTDFAGIITADSDGQHTPEDTAKMAEAMTEERKLWLGSRDFSSKNKNIPGRSKFGNRTTSLVFGLFYGKYLPDTQTGLRCFPRALCPFMLEVNGDRFEYEMNVLIHCAQEKLEMPVVPINTIYLEENKSSHFHPIRDSWRIYKLIIGNFLRFAAASLICWVVDQGIYHLLQFLILPKESMKVDMLFWHNVSLSILVAYFIARVFSSLLNFGINKNAVFRVNQCKGAIWRYFALAVGCLCICTFVTMVAEAYLPDMDWLIKLIVDTVMFFVNYKIQKIWVFKESKKAA